LPIDVQNWPASKQVFLVDEDPISVIDRKGARQQQQFSGRTIRFYYDSIWGGQRYEKVLDVSTPHEVSCAVAKGARTFAAVGGFRHLFADRPGVIYQIFVDGEKRFDSGEYSGFDALPITVDVRGARTWKVVVDSMRDGANAHDALLAEPRFLLK
jgi:hypothetical protein